jgi:hypothetical protein
MEPTTYRDPAYARPVARIDALEDATASSSLVGAVLVLAHGDLIALARHLVRTSTARRRQDTLALFFESDAVVGTPGVWWSTDGRRRLRAVYGDPLGRFESIDADGETLWTVRGPSPLLPVPPEPRAIDRRAARVHGRAREPRCFAGLPTALGGRPIAMADACLVILEARNDGVMIERRAANGTIVGDTWHADNASAQRQLAAEYGDRLGVWRDVEALPMELDHTSWGGYEPTRVVL